MNNQSLVAEEDILRAADVIRSGGVVAFPTETYYGLGADPFNREALLRVFTIKERSPHLPILTLVAEDGLSEGLAASIPSPFRLLMDAFWPGPLTLVCEAQPGVPGLLTGGTGTVGIRQSSSSVARQLVSSIGGPITATSANVSGSPPATSAGEVARSLGTAVDFVLDGGPTPGGKGSTLIGFADDSVYCIREGVIAFEEILTKIAPLKTPDTKPRRDI